MLPVNQERLVKREPMVSQEAWALPANQGITGHRDLRVPLDRLETQGHWGLRVPWDNLELQEFRGFRVNRGQ